jgi:hypothetical protein
MRRGDRIQRQIRRRAFERMDFLASQKADALHTRHTIDALEQVTGLARPELESIAGQVAALFAADGDNFFSIKDQLIASAAVCIPVLILILLMARWIW